MYPVPRATRLPWSVGGSPRYVFDGLLVLIGLVVVLSLVKHEHVSQRAH